LEGFGAHTLISRIVHRLLFAGTREQYISRRAEAYPDFDYVVGSGQVTDASAEKFRRLFGPSPVSIPSRAPDVFEPQAL
jgi:hypothetical protein